MKIIEKIDWLQSNNFGEWLDTRRKVEDQLSNEQPMWCVCRRLATGMHERYCRRFNNKVNSETVKRLAHLLPGAKK